MLCPCVIVIIISWTKKGIKGMFGKNRYIRELESENKRLREEIGELNYSRDDTAAKWEMKCSSIKRIKNSKVIFEKEKGMENLYIDDRLETELRFTIYDSKVAIENSLIFYLPIDEAECMKGVTVVAYLKMGYWDWKKGEIDVSKLYVAPQYRRKRYATKILNRLKECAEYYDAKTIRLIASAGEGITQEELEEMYQKCGFVKEIEYGNSMIYELK